MGDKPTKRHRGTGANPVRESKAMKMSQANGRRVRCLGPGAKDHYFINDGTMGNRLCYKCRVKLAMVPEACVDVVKTPPGWKLV